MTPTTAPPKTSSRKISNNTRATNPPTHQHQDQNQDQPTNPPTHQTQNQDQTQNQPTNPPTHQTQNQTQTQNQDQDLLDDDAATEKFMELLCAKKINGCCLVFNSQAEKFFLTKKDKFFPLGLKWRQFCNSALKIFDSYCENGDSHAEYSMNDHYKPFTKANAKDLIELIDDYRRNEMLNVSVVNEKVYDKKLQELQECVSSFNEKLSEIEKRFGINIRKRPITGDATLKILGMMGRGSTRTTKILNMAGWQKTAEKTDYAIWTTPECDPYAIDNYKEYTITPANINYANKTEGGATINRLPSDPVPPKSSPAPKDKSDEYYTLYGDIENELRHYANHFWGKTIYLPCDDNKKSKFYSYFYNNFKSLGLEKLITSCWYEDDTKRDIKSVTNISGSGLSYEEFLMDSGDCFNPEAQKILKECDIVVTNPPFSKFAKFVELLDDHKKNFLIIGPLMSAGSKKILELFKDDKLWLGKTMRDPKTSFERPDGSYKDVGLVRWYQNLTYQEGDHPLELTCDYDPAKYKQIDGHNAINVDYLKDIPKDCYKKMAVPITFLDYYNANDYDLLGGLDKPTVDGDPINKRLIIKRR